MCWVIFIHFSPLAVWESTSLPLFPLAESSNGNHQRYKCKYFREFLFFWLFLRYVCVYIFICSLKVKLNIILSSCTWCFGLYRHNGKSLYIRKNYSTSSIKHNHKLFHGDLLSFIQVLAATFGSFTFFNLYFYSLLTFRIQLSDHLCFCSGIRTTDSRRCAKLCVLYQSEW